MKEFNSKTAAQLQELINTAYKADNGLSLLQQGIEHSKLLNVLSMAREAIDIYIIQARKEQEIKNFQELIK